MNKIYDLVYAIKGALKYNTKEEEEFQQFCLDNFSFDYLKYIDGKLNKNLVFTNVVSLENHDNQIAGFIIYERAPNGCLSINQIRIAEQHRNKEVLQFLVSDMVRRLKELGLGQFTDLSSYIFCNEADEIEQEQMNWLLEIGFEKTSLKRRNFTDNTLSTMLTYLIDFTESPE